MKKEFTVQHFRDKFSAIPENKWCVGTQDNGKGQHCAIGLLHPEHGGMANNVKKFDPTGEISALENLFFNAGILYEPFPYFRLGDNIAAVNNGNHSKFKQDTPKQRILAALDYVEEQLLIIQS